jgi:hypothetical protein
MLQIRTVSLLWDFFLADTVGPLGVDNSDSGKMNHGPRRTLVHWYLVEIVSSGIATSYLELSTRRLFLREVSLEYSSGAR